MGFFHGLWENFVNKKRTAQSVPFFCPKSSDHGGGGGCRTRVRKYVPWNLSERSLFVYFPFRRHKGQRRAVGSFINSSCEAKLIRTTFPVSN